MRLNNEGLKDRKSWENAGYSLPEYDRETVTKATRENPFWIHFGAGNIFRAFQAIFHFPFVQHTAAAVDDQFVFV